MDLVKTLLCLIHVWVLPDTGPVRVRMDKKKTEEKNRLKLHILLVIELFDFIVKDIGT